MSTYLHDDEISFCTLAIGDDYRQKVATQIQSVLKFTPYHIHIVTDNISEFGNYYGSRVHYIKLEDVTDLPVMTKSGHFNYNLKLVPIMYMMEKIRPHLCVYMDADSFLFGSVRNLIKCFPDSRYGIFARTRQALNSPDQSVFVGQKAGIMNIDITNITVPLPIENIMFFKSGTLTIPFLTEWNRLAKLSNDLGCTPFMEAFEMAVAIHNTKIPIYHIDNSFPMVDDFRTIHHGKIHTPFII